MLESALGALDWSNQFVDKMADGKRPLLNAVDTICAGR